MARRNDRVSKTMLIKISPDMIADDASGLVGQKIKPKASVSFEEAEAPRTSVAEVPVVHTEMQQLFQGVYDAGLITDLSGKIIDANVRATQFLVYSVEELNSLQIVDIIVGLDSSTIETIVANLENDKFTLLEANCVRKDGYQFPAEITTSKIRSSSEGNDQLCFFIRDITNRKKAEEALQWAHTQLEARVHELNDAITKLQEHDKAKSQFVSNVSHEFRTPLASISYMTNNILKGIFGAIPDGVKTYIEMIREDSQRLARTVEDILDVSRIEAGGLVLNGGKVNFTWLTRHTVESLMVHAESEQLTLVFESNNINSFVDCDLRRMERAITNVVKNAIKFNERHGNVCVSLRVDEAEPGFIVLDVEDTGIGIEPEYLPRVTERFFRVGEFVSGTGLGLAICKEIVECHGGTLKVASPPPGKPKGTLVSIYLPMSAPAKVVVLSDNDENRNALVNDMTNHGFEVVYGSLLEMDVNLVQQAAPDVICVDWVGPGMEGSIVLAGIKGDEVLRKVPVFVVTGVQAEPLKMEIIDGLELPVLNCPWNEKDLMNCIEDCMLPVHKTS